MTVPSTTAKSGPYNGNGATKSFPYGFRILDAAHIKVLRVVGGVESVVTTGFTVSGVGATTGAVIFTTAPAAGTTITLVRNVPFTQNVDLENQGAFFAEVIESAVDLAAMRDQQQQETLDRAFVFPVSDVPVSRDLPVAAARARKALVFAADGSIAVSVDDYVDQAASAAAAAASAAGYAGTAATSAGQAMTSRNAAVAAQGAAETAKTAAETAAAAAAAGLSVKADKSASVSSFGARTTALAGTVSGLSVLLQGSVAAGDGGGGLFSEIGAAPTHAGFVTDAAGRFFELAARRVTPAQFKTAGNTWADAFNAAAVFLAQKGGGVLDLDGRAYTFTAPLVVNGSDITVDASGARVVFSHNAGTCLTFGDGATQRHRNALLGGYWEQTLACTQFMLEIRGVRRFMTDGVVTAQLYSYAKWGRAADAVPSYIWTQSNEVIDLRTATLSGGVWVNGHSHGIVVENAQGAWYQSNIQLEAANSFDNENFATTAGLYLPSTFAPARLDHWMASNVFVKGFSRNIFLDNARAVNIQWASVRVDDSRIAAMHVNASVAGKGGIEGGTINLDVQGTSIGNGLLLQHTSASTAVSGQLRVNITAKELTKEIVSISSAGGTIRDMVVDLQSSDWLPDAARNAIELIQSGTGAMRGFSLPTVSTYAATAGNAQRPLITAGTVSNAKYGLVNAVNFATPTPNF